MGVDVTDGIGVCVTVAAGGVVGVSVAIAGGVTTAASDDKGEGAGVSLARTAAGEGVELQAAKTSATKAQHRLDQRADSDIA